MLSADVMNCASDCRGGVQPSFQGLSREVNGFLMNWSLGESSSSHCMETSHWLSVYLIVYIYLYSSHNKYTMAFKIKSAKIFFFFFWNKRTHSDVVVGSSSMFEHTLGCYRTSTGRGNEALPHPDPAGQHRLRHARRDGCQSLARREREAAECSAGGGGDTTASTPNQAGLTSSGFSV